jgi:hypothetical protein
VERRRSSGCRPGRQGWAPTLEVEPAVRFVDRDAGEFRDLSTERAKIMADGINLFMRRRTVTAP